MIFDHFGRHFGAPRVTFRDSVLKWGAQGGPDQKKQKMVVGVRGFLGHFGPKFNQFPTVLLNMLRTLLEILSGEVFESIGPPF